MSESQTILRLGTRGSLLARSQSQIVADEIEKRRPGTRVELVIIKTTGDRITDKPLRDVGGKGLFTKELEQALLAREIDFAVHSFKDVPVTMPLVDQEDLVIAAVPQREDPRDVNIMLDPARGAMPHEARVGTSSLRRRCQILEFAPDANIIEVRGNIDTRIKKLRTGELDVLILAMAGLKRAGLFDANYMQPLEVQSMLPAPGQGALALQCRKDDLATRETLSVLHHEATELCVRAERALVAALEGDCHSPIASFATIDRGQLHLLAAVGAREGVPPVLRADAKGPSGDVNRVVHGVMESLTRQGVQAHLRRGR